mmetsp:Transcript_21751/g.33245  ORF Transcript_21751/g.33245 Transcript_21751/m.33245 type:complete len:173 (+) Transcript_21751:1-519(+)
MTATGGEADQSINEISRSYVVCGREWTSKVAEATSASLEGGESISLSEYEKNIISSLSEECARLEVEAMSLMARPKGDRDVFGEDDDVDDDDLSCYAEEEALATAETSLCEELSFISYDDLPEGIYESDAASSGDEAVCSVDGDILSLSALTSTIGILGRSLRVPERIMKPL